MLKYTRLAATISVVLLALTTACSSSEQSQNTSSVKTSPTPTPPSPSPRVSKAKASPPKPSPTPQADRFPEALDTAMSAATVAQSAQSKEDWNLVVSRWQSAIALLKAVPKSSPNYAIAQKKITDYQRNLAYAQKQQASGSKPTNTAIALPWATTAPRQSSPPTPAAATAPRQSNPPAPAAATAPRQTSSSTVAPEVALASHLKQIGAKFYGTYWCGYCNKQKEIFGPQAFSQINYIECDEKGKNARPDLCIKAKISGYPTWEIKGQLHPGLLSLQTLANLSGYQGDRNFRS